MYTGLLLPPLPAQRKHDIKCFAHFFPITRDYTIHLEHLLVVKNGLREHLQDVCWLLRVDLETSLEPQQQNLLALDFKGKIWV